MQNILLFNENRLVSEQWLSFPIFCQTPISKFDRICILKMIFPTLFLEQKVDINLLLLQKTHLTYRFNICYVIKMANYFFTFSIPIYYV